MKVNDIILGAQRASKTLITFEILPPARGNGIQELFKHLDVLMEVRPPFINVTYHRREPSAVSNGLQINKSRRPGTIGICAAIQQHYKVDAVTHLICGGFTKAETEDALIELSFLGVDNILALRGDGLVKDNKKFVPTEGGHAYTTDLVKQIVQLNHGKYLEDEEGDPTNFCIGVAGYPEKHFEAPSMQADIQYLKQKLQCGASYVVTQMFFDNQHYFNFVKQCREAGIHAPIIPGIKPITRKKQLDILPSVFYAQIPPTLAHEITLCQDDKAVAEVGQEWLAHQVKELKDAGVPIVHFYTVGSVSKPIMSAIKQAF